MTPNRSPTDPGTGGQPSDHLTVFMRPISRTKREILVRPMKLSGIDMFGNWVTRQNWEEVLEAENVDKKSEILQNILMDKIDEFLPQKKRIISSDDQPYCTDKMKTLKRQKTREYRKHRTSTKYKELNIQYQKEISAAKNSYYKNIIKDLKHSKPKQSYSKLKKTLLI